jgi:hypothetical protein
MKKRRFNAKKRRFNAIHGIILLVIILLIIAAIVFVYIQENFVGI